ncbi:MAG: ribose 5-phosphate isomerase B [Armatimonadota bacterium]
MKVAIGCDHGGYALKQDVIEAITAAGHEPVDLGTHGPESVDYVDYAVKVGEAIVTGEAELGILTCGTGIGMSIAANKLKGVYAARAEDCYSGRMAREHNAANVLCVGARTAGPELIKETIRAFLAAQPSSDARHQRRRDKFYALEGR